MLKFNLQALTFIKNTEFIFKNSSNFEEITSILFNCTCIIVKKTDNLKKITIVILKNTSNVEKNTGDF